ncbi:Rz1-like lysis system protein LysC [Erwinia rhapontici]|uniref:Rz1-like lysis system protein LysC n=1 Tax=Erwinia rhapontici TaxID=55212 RepID=UPI003B9FB4A5
MLTRHYAAGLLLLCLMTLSGCTVAPLLPAPEVIWIGCPHVTSCPFPSNSLLTQGDLAADNRQLEAALASCGLQVEVIKECQEQHDAETEATTGSADNLRTTAAAKP